VKTHHVEDLNQLSIHPPPPLCVSQNRTVRRLLVGSGENKRVIGWLKVNSFMN